MIKFEVNNTEYKLPKDYLEFNSFEVKSHPKNYMVVFNNAFIIGDSRFLLVDKNVHNLYGIEKVQSNTMAIDANEENKTIDTVLSVVDWLNSHDFTKADTLTVMGGGILQDIGGSVAKLYKRGINWVFIPTTLLSMVDSCIGGKVGLNYDGKNQLALFSAPSKVIIATDFLDTLSEKDIKSGLGEALKLCIVGGDVALEVYKDYLTSTDIEPLIKTALHIKKEIIEDDEFEQGNRSVLNYGHTGAHCLEIMSNYRLTHGQAVVLGMYVVNKLYVHHDEYNHIGSDYYETYNKLCLDLIGDISDFDIDYSQLKDLLKKDRKTMGDFVNFVVKLKGNRMATGYKFDLNGSLVDDIAYIIEGIR